MALVLPPPSVPARSIPTGLLGHWRNISSHKSLRTRNSIAYLRVHIAHLRDKIEANPASPHMLLTESGVGYRFVDDRTK